MWMRVIMANTNEGIFYFTTRRTLYSILNERYALAFYLLE